MAYAVLSYGWRETMLPNVSPLEMSTVYIDMTIVRIWREGRQIEKLKQFLLFTTNRWMGKEQVANHQTVQLANEWWLSQWPS